MRLLAYLGEFRHCCLVRLIRHEELVQAIGKEAGCSRLPHDDVDDVASIKVASLAEEDFLTVVMQVGAECELPLEAAVGQISRNSFLQGPSRECASTRFDIVFGIATNTHCE